MEKNFVDKSCGPDISEELDPLVEKFLANQTEEEYRENANQLAFLFFACGLHRCFYLDDWTLGFSNKLEKSLHDWLHDSEDINATRAIIHKFARFVHANRPFKHGLPI